MRAYNSAAFVATAVESVLAQTLAPEFYELVVIDDGSSDQTLDILKNYGNKITLFQQNHLGAIVALNKAIDQAVGSHMIILDSDDTFQKDILEKMFLVVKNNQADFVYCDYYENELATGKQKIVSLKKNIFNSVAGGILFDKNIVKKLGGYDASLFFPEYDLLIKIRQVSQGYYLPYPLFTYNRHKESMTANKENVKKGMEQLFLKYKKNFNIRAY